MQYKNLNFKRVLAFPKQLPPEHFWILCWYGRIFYSNKEERYHIEAFFTETPKLSYYMQDWNIENTTRVTLPLEKTVIVPLGSLFNFRGRMVASPSKFIAKRVYKLNGIRLQSSRNYRDSGIYSKLAGTMYPVYDKNIYDHCPFYYTEQSMYGKITKVIIPMHVILDYFFGMSTLTLHNLVHKNFYESVKFWSEDSSKKIGNIKYDGRLINDESLRDIAGYLFATGGTGSKTITGLSLSHFQYFARERAVGRAGRAYLNVRIPFETECTYSIFGQYISDDNDGSSQKFIAYGISSVKPTIPADNLFTVEKINYQDISKKSDSSDPDADGNASLTRAARYDIENKVEYLILGTAPSGSVSGVQVADSAKPTFSKAPGFEEEEFFANQIAPKEIEIIEMVQIKTFTDSLNQTEQGSASQKVSFRPINEDISWYQIFKRAIKILETKGFSALRMHEFEYISTIGSSMIGDLLIYEIKFLAAYYYLIESGYGKYIPIMRMSEGNVRMSQQFLKEIIHLAASKYEFAWSNFARENPVENIKVLTPNRHSISFLKDDPQIIDIEKTADSLASRILKKVNADMATYNSLENQ